VLAAARRRIPTAVMEADAHLGLANRLAAPLARRVFLSFPIPGRDGAKYRVTGRPIPSRSRPTSREEGRRVFGLPEQVPVLLVFGGSLGARALNELVVSAFGAEGPAVLHLSGTRDYAVLGRRLEQAGGGGYTLIDYEPNLGDALAASDLVLARSGGSVFEIAAAGKPAILVPYPHATADHQTANARWMTSGGAAELLLDAELTPDLLQERVGELLADPKRLARMSDASRKLAMPDAASRIAAEVLKAL